MSTVDRKTIFNVPNIVTLGRIAVIPVMMALMMLQGPERSYEYNKTLSLFAAVVCILTGISDLIDGYYARKYQMVSLMGKFFDPMADKLVHLTIMVMMISMGRLPAWLVVIHLFREIYIMGLRAVAAGEDLIISAGVWGKRKTAWLNVALPALLIYYPIFGVSAYTVGWVCFVIATIYSLLSAVEYSILFFRTIHRRS